MSQRVWDASAVLMVLHAEPGWEGLSAALGEVAISAVNLAEVIGKLADAGVPEGDIDASLGSLPMAVIPFDEGHAYAAGLLRPLTRSRGLSLGDRACLALALTLGAPVVTADRSWSDLGLDLDVIVPR